MFAGQLLCLPGGGDSFALKALFYFFRQCQYKPVYGGAGAYAEGHIIFYQGDGGGAGEFFYFFGGEHEILV